MTVPEAMEQEKVKKQKKRFSKDFKAAGGDDSKVKEQKTMEKGDEALPDKPHKEKKRNSTTEKQSKKVKRKHTDLNGKEAPEKRRKKGDEAPRQSKIAHQDGAPDWRQIRADAADVKERRKSHNKMFEVGKHMKKLWEELRMEKCGDERRNQLIKELSGLVSGRVLELVRAHDRARVCETLFQLGSVKTRAALFAEVRPQLAELSRDKYARHFVLKILSYGSAEQKAAVGEAFRGRVTALMGHKFSNEVGDVYFRDCATPEARQRMLMEFYGAEFFLSTEQPRDLAQLIGEHPEKRVIYLTNTRSQLQSFLDKQLLTGSLAHRLLREYLTLCAEADRADVIESLREAVVQMLHTRDGARVGLMCCWWGNTKDRKAIVKSLKTYVQKVCTDEHGFMVMLALLDVVDDTRLMRKALLEEMMVNVAEIVADEHGKKVVHYLLSPRDTTYFHPSLIAALAEGDNNATRETSELQSKIERTTSYRTLTLARDKQKDPEVRRREIREAVSEPLLKTASIHCLEWIRDSNMCILLAHILTKCSGDSLKLPLSQLARCVAEPVVSVSDAHLVNNSAAYIQLKKLIQADRQRASADSPVLFSSLILRELTEEALLSWLASNRTAFLLVLMLEADVASLTEKVVEVILPHSKKIKPTCKGAEILKKKLSAASKQLRAVQSGD